MRTASAVIARRAAPLALTSYEDMAKRGALIAMVTHSRYMAPWHAEHGFGEFADERRLRDAQIAMITNLVNARMPEGDTAKIARAYSLPARLAAG